MTISSISSSLPSYSEQDTQRTTARDLVSAIQSGDLKTAQQDYATLTQGASGISQSSPLAKDFSAIGQALQAGDISAAQQALTTLQTDVHKVSKGHHHHHHHSQAAASPDSAAATNAVDGNASSNSPTATTSTFSVSA